VVLVCLKQIRRCFAAKNFEMNVAFISSIPSYSQSSSEAIQAMANMTRRIFYPANKAIVKEGDEPDRVYFCVRGKLKVVKNHGAVQKRCRLACPPLLIFVPYEQRR
jgi:CRP-like cAMP-binding protein